MTVSCGQRFKDEFQVRNFLLGYDYPGTFARSEWKRGPSVLYLVWRAIWFLYHVAIFGLRAYLTRFLASSVQNQPKFLIFLTTWAYMLLVVTNTVDFIITLYYFITSRKELQGMKGVNPWYNKVLWVLSNLTNTSAFVVSLMYWVLIYDNAKGFQGYDYISVFTHGANLIYVVLNLLVTAVPVRLLHFYQPFILAITYGIFSATYVLAGGTNDVDEPYIYSVQNWRNSPGISAGLSLGAAIAAIFLHWFVYFIHLFRVCVAQTCTRNASVADLV
ncbi:protein rolling stone-like [Haliotis cracherodii]|uniref:protein rolling stone-like n=1 Tax=Haliotis cracherodii TaxID=6455 RepID=UPI0039E90829